MFRSGSQVLTNDSALSLTWTVYQNVSTALAIYNNKSEEKQKVMFVLFTSFIIWFEYVQEFDCKLMLDLEYLTSFLSRVPTLQLTNVSGGHHVSDKLIHVSGLAHLTCLKLTRIPAASVQDLVQLRSQLKSVSLVRCTRVSLSSLLDTCLGSSPAPDTWSQLTRLTVSHCNLTCLSPALQYTPYLTHLDCSHNKITGIRKDLFSVAKQF